MEYPGTWFTRPLRLLLLGGFIVAFFVLAPLVLLLTAGYRYDWKEGLLRTTGSISIDVLPRNAVVYLDNIKLIGRIPLRLKTVVPRTYTIRLSAPGYIDWQKEFRVNNKQTTYLKDIELIKKTQPKRLASGAVRTLALSPAGRHLLYQLDTGESASEVWLKNIVNSQTTLLFTQTHRTPLRISWGKKNGWVALQTEAASPAPLWVIEVNRPDDRRFNLTELFPEPIKKIQWADTPEPELYLETGGKIVIFSPVTGVRRVVVNKNFSDWLLVESAFWTLMHATSTGRLVVTKDTLGINPSTRLLPLRTATSSPTRSYELRDGAEGTVLIAEKRGKQMLLITPPAEPIILPGNDFFRSPHDAWWLVWSPWELWGYTAGEEPLLLNRSSDHLKKVVPLDTHNTLALVWESHTTVLFPYYNVNHELIAAAVEHLAADGERRIIYFAAAIENQPGLWELAY